MNKEFNSKEEFIIYILEEFNKKPAPIAFGDFFLEIGPSFGIDSFRDLLEELYQQNLLTKLENSGKYIPELGIRTVDLRFGISVKGIEYLKQNKSTVIMSKQENQEKITVFVTYSWDNEEHEEKVHAFTNMLRDNGFHAEVDKMLIQGESAKDFKIMMHKGMTNYRKVIVVLSKGYKEKAEAFRGGVGTEYSLILKDIEDNPNKYILVSFSGRDNSITPLFFKSREILDLKTDNDVEKQKLFSKLLDQNIYEFNDVASTLPQVKKIKAPAFFTEKKAEETTNLQLIEIQDLNITQDNASYFAQKIKYIELNLSVGFKNLHSLPLNDYNIEVYYPKQTISYEVDGRIEGNYKVVTTENNNRVFSQQLKVINLEKIILRDFTINEVIDKSIIVKIYCENGTYEREFPLREFVIKNHFSQMSQKLNKDLFVDRDF
ncbi:MAG: TIR domain-containing protein [Flavobacterium lindanitolerans]|uniref:SEFIR domain-containing protein n=1 Tax=Flavobacterium lindanitolerans TaxID=428988 RepID=UPI001A506470|nr:SEFIR domain-containing protein [Flavobacterium lindanitolerans]MBL7868349.1 TIR domain-containing protein [Flavobacterium lindanitolerans]